jgi:hypothetical protein
MVKYSAALPLVVCTVLDSERSKFDEFRTFLSILRLPEGLRDAST